MSKTVLVVDDDELLRRSLAFHLEQAGFRPRTLAAAEPALALVQSDPPDLVLLDINLPGMDGLEAFRRLRTISQVPVIFLTARRREIDEILGLELGANDYVTKPFDKDVLIARVRLALRLAQGQEATARRATVAAGDLLIDSVSHTVTVSGRPVDLTPREFGLLQALASEPGRVFSADELLDRVWGSGFAGEPQVVYVQIRALREKLEEDPGRPRRLLTVRGIGYKLIPQEGGETGA